MTLDDCQTAHRFREQVSHRTLLHHDWGNKALEIEHLLSANILILI